jgi:hypothetical protein
MNRRRHDRIALRARSRSTPFAAMSAKRAMTLAAEATLRGDPDAVDKAQAALDALQAERDRQATQAREGGADAS